MAIPIGSCHDLAIWINGGDYVGHAKSIEFDPIEFNKVEEERLGMLGTPKSFSALDPITGKITWTSPRQDWAAIFADPLTAFNLQCRGSITINGPTGRVEEQPLLMVLTVISDQHAMGKYEQKTTAEYEVSFSTNYLKQTINGADVTEIDIFNYILKVNGTDLMQQRRANLGF